MPNTFKRLLKLTGAGILTVLLTWSCENDPASIGLEALPSSDLLSGNSKETNIYGRNLLPENIVSDNSSLNLFPFGILGHLNDPLFGSTKADMVTEFTLSADLPDFRYDKNTGEIDEAKFFPDSAVLNLAYNYENWYGDTLANHTIQVYELSERLSPASSASRYYSDYVISGKYDPYLLGEKTIHAGGGINDSTWQANGYVNVISIPLDDLVAEKLFNLTEVELDSANLFKDKFNGLYITLTDPENPNATGSLIKINLLHVKSNLTLHYRKEIRELTGEGDEEGTLLEIEKLNYVFPINESARFFSRFEHDHTGRVQFDATTTDHLMIQGMAGSQAQIDLSPLINEWADSLSSSDERFGISGADLIFYADTFYQPGNLFLPINETLVITHRDEKNSPIAASGLDADGKTIPAFRYSTATYNKNSNSYTFRMNQDYFEKAAKGEIEVKPFFLEIPYTQFNFRRISLFNYGTEDPPVFKVRYVKFQD
jgi:hypothetical protein